jgi:hypothetical protein
MASLARLESLLARVRQRAAEPRPRRPASRVSLRSYAEVEDEDIEEYEDELVEIVDEPSLVPPPLRQSPIPASPATQRSEPPPPPLPLPRPLPTWDAVAARAARSLRPVAAPAVSVPAPAAVVPSPTRVAPEASATAVVARSPVRASAPVTELRGRLPLVEGESFVDLLERSLELGG